jgi:hypothetical protein
MIKVELGFTASGASAPFFTLDDPVLGVLDSADGVLGGAEILVDVTAFFRSFSISRGKSRELDRFGAGQATVVFNNADRTFDPTFAASPFFGQIRPRRQLRISVDNVIQFEGTIDDWNIEYDRGGNSLAVAQAFDGFANLSQIDTAGLTLTPGLSSAQIIQVLDNVSWPVSKRDIETGGAILIGQAIDDGTNSLQLMQTITDSEPGDLFISKDGSVKFINRNVAFASTGLVLSDTGAEIPFTDIKVIFGSELLFNRASVTNATDSEVAQDESSISLYGERDITRATFLDGNEQLQNLASFLVSQFKDPEYRFESLTMNLRAVSPANRAGLLALEIGDVVRVEFTPNGIAPAIERFGKIIKIDHAASDNQEEMTIGLQSVEGSLFTLDDAEFGILDASPIGW